VGVCVCGCVLCVWVCFVCVSVCGWMWFYGVFCASLCISVGVRVSVCVCLCGCDLCVWCVYSCGACDVCVVFLCLCVYGFV